MESVQVSEGMSTSTLICIIIITFLQSVTVILTQQIKEKNKQKLKQIEQLNNELNQSIRKQEKTLHKINYHQKYQVGAFVRSQSSIGQQQQQSQPSKKNSEHSSSFEQKNNYIPPDLNL